MITVSGGHNGWWTASLTKTTIKHSFNHTAVDNLTFQEAADYTAKLIAKNYDNLYIGMSGGLDSSFVAEVFYRNKIPFTPIIGYIVTEDKKANCDYFHAMYWCEQRNIKPTVVDFTVDDPRLVKQFVVMSKKINLVTSGCCMQLAILEQVNHKKGHLVIGDPMIPNLTEGNNYYNPIGEIFDSPWFAIITELIDPTHPGGFFFYTPEILLAMAKEIDVTANESVAKTNLYKINYRPKTHPDYSCISEESINKLHSWYTAGEGPTEYWTKQELIAKLTK